MCFFLQARVDAGLPTAMVRISLAWSIVWYVQIPCSSLKLAILVVTCRKMYTLMISCENKLANERLTFKQKLTNSTNNTGNTISILKRSSNVLVSELQIGAFTVNFKGQLIHFYRLCPLLFALEHLMELY